MTAGSSGSPTSPRLLWTVVLGLVASAGSLWGASALASPPQPALGALALLCLAGIAAVLALGHWLRRVVGGILLLQAGFIGWMALAPLVSSNAEESAPQGGKLLLLGLSAAALLLAGILVVSRAGRMPSMGARYSAPGDARARDLRDPEQGFWRELDRGGDPTIRPDEEAAQPGEASAAPSAGISRNKPTARHVEQNPQ